VYHCRHFGANLLNRTHTLRSKYSNLGVPEWSSGRYLISYRLFTLLDMAQTGSSGAAGWRGGWGGIIEVSFIGVYEFRLA
jgi:hypothetical protein